MKRTDVKTASDTPIAKRAAVANTSDVVPSPPAEAAAGKVPGGEAGETKTDETT